MRRMYSNKELTEIIKQVIEEQGLGGGGLDVVKFVEEMSMAEYPGVKIPFVIALFDTNNQLVATSLINYEYGPTTFVDPDMGTTYEVNFTNIQYDEDAKQLTADVNLTEQS